MECVVSPHLRAMFDVAPQKSLVKPGDGGLHWDNGGDLHLAGLEDGTVTLWLLVTPGEKVLEGPTLWPQGGHGPPAWQGREGKQAGFQVRRCMKDQHHDHKVVMDHQPGRAMKESKLDSRQLPRKEFLTPRVVRHWPRLPKEMGDAPSLEMHRLEDTAGPRTTCLWAVWEVTGFEMGFLVLCCLWWEEGRSAAAVQHVCAGEHGGSEENSLGGVGLVLSNLWKGL